MYCVVSFDNFTCLSESFRVSGDEKRWQLFAIAIISPILMRDDNYVLCLELSVRGVQVAVKLYSTELP